MGLGVVRTNRSHAIIVAVGDVETVHRFTCPVCGYPELYDEPQPSFGGGSYEICASCGFQFGVSDEDEGLTFEEWRSSWVGRGSPWSSANAKPHDWDPAAQLAQLMR